MEDDSSFSTTTTCSGNHSLWILLCSSVPQAPRRRLPLRHKLRKLAHIRAQDLQLSLASHSSIFIDPILSQRVSNAERLVHKRGIGKCAGLRSLELHLQLPSFQVIGPDMVIVGPGVDPPGSGLKESPIDLGARLKQRAEKIPIDIEAAGDTGIVEQRGSGRGAP